VIVKLSPHLEEFVQQKIDDGLYRDAEEVLEEALQLLDERDRFERLRATLIEAKNQIARQEGVVFDDERFAIIQQSARRKLEAGQQPNPDVLP
jgi:antitoxin ParD1/3/4